MRRLRRWLRHSKWMSREYRVVYDGWFDCHFAERKPKALYQRQLRRGEAMSNDLPDGPDGKVLVDDLDTSWTVAQLLKALKKMPKKSYVITEGCDCFGTVSSVDLIDGGKTVAIRR